MTSLQIAHLHEQGQDMVIVPLDSGFDYKSNEQQQAAIAEIQRHSHAAGLRGHVVPVWPSGNRMKFIAPRQWHSFFQSIDLGFVQANLNKTLSW